MALGRRNVRDWYWAQSESFLPLPRVRAAGPLEGGVAPRAFAGDLARRVGGMRVRNERAWTGLD
jgi:hypothetical protein